MRTLIKSKSGVGLMLAGIIVMSGCKKSSEPENAVPAQPASAPDKSTPAQVEATPARANPGAPVNIPVSPQQSPTAAPAVAVGPSPPDLVPLSQAVQIFIFRKKRRPGSVGELVSAGLIKEIPPVPQGMKLVISPTTPQVIMVKQ